MLKPLAHQAQAGRSCLPVSSDPGPSSEGLSHSVWSRHLRDMARFIPAVNHGVGASFGLPCVLRGLNGHLPSEAALLWAGARGRRAPTADTWPCSDSPEGLAGVMPDPQR